MNAFEIFIKSRSFALAFKRGLRHFNGKISFFYFNKQKVFFRIGSTDAGDICEILLAEKKSPYFIPNYTNPRIIWDIGANIGLASIFFKKQFPDAQIFAFEPQSDNFKLLAENMNGYSNVKLFHYGLGSTTEKKDLVSRKIQSPNSFSLYRTVSGDEICETVQIKSFEEAFEESGKHDIDILKIDTEGAEYSIILSIPTEILKKIKIIVGELHNVHDFKTLSLLEDYFKIALSERTIDRPQCNFCAINYNQVFNMV